MNFHKESRFCQNLSIQDGDIIMEDDDFCSMSDLQDDGKVIYTPLDEFNRKEREFDPNQEPSTKEAMDAAALNIMNEKKISSDLSNEILPKKITFNNLQSCLVLLIESPNEFYVQREVDYECLLHIVEIIDSYVKISHTSRLHPVIGNIYIGQYTSDDNWYRAKVLKKLDDGQYFVRYIDYANKETIDLSRLKECPASIRNIPEFAIRCSLLDILPIGGHDWSDEALSIFHTMMEDGDESQLMIYNTEEIGSSYVCNVEVLRIFHAQNCSGNVPFSVRKALAFMGHATLRGRPYTYKVSSTELSQYDKMYSMPYISVNTEMTVRPRKIHTPWSFYLIAESSLKQYELENSSLQEHCRQSDIINNVNWMIFHPLTDMVCLSLIGGSWNRAIVKKVHGKGEIEVLQVDNGCKIKISYRDIRKLPDSFNRFPVQAIKCSLVDILPLGSKREEEWTVEAINYFSHWLHAKHQLKANVCKKREELLEVDLTAFNGKKIFNIAHILVEKNYAVTVLEKFKPEYSGCIDIDPHEDKKYASMNKTSIVISDRNEIFIKQPEQKHQERKSRINVKTSKRVDITFLGLKSPDCIFIRFASQSVFCRELQKRLWQDWHLFEKARPCDITIGGIYAVEYKKNNYARLKILKIENNQCMTYLIDLGGLKAYAIEQLYLLTGVLLKTKGFAAIVKLTNIIPTCGSETWPNTAIDYLKEVLSEKEEPFIVICASAFKNPMLYNLKVLPVQLGWVEVNVPGAFDPAITTYPIVNQVLINSGLALPDRRDSATVTTDYEEESMSEPSISERREIVATKPERISKFSAPAIPPRTWPTAVPLKETTFSAIVSNVDNKCNIQFHLVEDSSLLQQMEMTYEFKYANTKQTNDDLCWGILSPVIARYHGNDNWYRAIVKEVNEESIHVCYVDYGNNDDICVTTIRACDELYMKTPVLCYKGKLAGVVPLSEWKEKDLDYIHQLIVEQRVNISLLEPYQPDTILPIKIEIADTKQDLASLLVSIGTICRFEDATDNTTRETPEIEKDLVPDMKEDTFPSIDYQSVESSTGPEAATFAENSFDFSEEPAFADESLAESPVIDFKLPKHRFPTDSEEVFPVHLVKIINARNAFIIPYDDGQTKIPFISDLKGTRLRFNSIMETIQRNINQWGQVIPSNIPSDKLYLCKNEGEWKRICILGEYEEELKVRYFDYGTEEFVNMADIKNLPQAAYGIPPMAVPIYITDSESQALRSLLYKFPAEVIMNAVKNLDTTIFASVLESRRIPKILLFIVNNGRRYNLFEHISNIQ